MGFPERLDTFLHWFKKQKKRQTNETQTKTIGSRSKTHCKLFAACDNKEYMNPCYTQNRTCQKCTDGATWYYITHDIPSPNYHYSKFHTDTKTEKSPFRQVSCILNKYSTRTAEQSTSTVSVSAAKGGKAPKLQSVFSMAGKLSELLAHASEWPRGAWCWVVFYLLRAAHCETCWKGGHKLRRKVVLKT